MHLVMLETNGNQRFVFASPRLRDAIGASYLLTQLDPWAADEYGKLQPEQSRSYEDACVSRSSGKVILRVDDDVAARQLISAVTRRVAAQAPGMDVTGVYIGIGNGPVTGDHLRKIHEVAARHAVSRAPAQARFPQMPFLVRGRDSSLPASPRLKTFIPALSDEAKDDRATALALPSRIKRYYALHGREGFLESMAEDGGEGALEWQNLRRDTNKLEEELKQQLDEQLTAMERAFEGKAPLTPPKKDERLLSRVAVIHIDGNGIGALMQNLQVALEEVQKHPELLTRLKQSEEKLDLNKNNSDAFPNFVKAINAALEKAIADACRHAYWLVARLQYPEVVRDGLTDEQIVHVVPVLLGGDDATVIADGDYAIPFTAEFLRAFEQATAADPLLSVVAEKGKFTAGAGIAIVRTAFPFHLAYDLAEHLATQAKTIGKRYQVSTFSYHQLVDTTILDPAALIARYKDLACNTFVVSESGQAAASSNEGDVHPTEAPQWAEMLRKAALFTGLTPAEGQSEVVAFPGTRAQRMRRYAALIAAGKNKAKYGLPAITDGPNKREGKKPSQLLADEWEVAKGESEALNAACEAIGSHTFFFDLINLRELLPEAYLRGELGLTSDDNDASGK